MNPLQVVIRYKQDGLNTIRLTDATIPPRIGEDIYMPDDKEHKVIHVMWNTTLTLAIVTVK